MAPLRGAVIGDDSELRRLLPFGIALLLLATAQVITAAPQNYSTDPSGKGSVLFQFNQNSNRDPIIWTGPFYNIVIPTTTHANLRLDSEQWMPNLGTFHFSIDLNNSNGPGLTPSRGRAGISDVRLGRWTMAAGAGDVMFDVYNLDLALSSLYRPNTGLRGFQFDASEGRMHYSFFGGRTTADTGYFGESELVSRQSVLGARAVAQLSGKLALGIGMLHTSEPQEKDGTSSLATNSLTASAVYHLIPQVQFSAETNVAQYRLVAPGEGRSGYDASGVIGARVQSSRVSADVSVLRLGPTYAPFSYTSLGDRQGISGSGDYKVNQRLSIYGSFNRWRNNVMARPSEPVLQLYHELFGGSYLIGSRNSVGARIGSSGMDPLSNYTGVSSSRIKNLYLDFSHQWQDWRLTLRGSEIHSSDGRADTTQAVRRRLDLEVQHHLRENTEAWAAAGIINDTIGSTLNGYRSGPGLAGRVGINWSLRPSLSFYSEGSYNQELGALTALRIDNVALNGGLHWLLRRDITVRVEGRYSRDASELNMLGTFPLGPEAALDLENYLRANKGNDYQIAFHIQKIMKWGRKPAGRVAAPGIDASRPRDFGSIEGVVFEDLDNDGVMGPAEKGVANVALVLDNQERIAVDSAGRFTCKTVSAGEHQLSLELTTVPALFDVGPGAARKVEVVKKRAASEQFPLVRLGKIQGKIRVVDAPPGSDGPPIMLARQRETPEVSVVISLNDGLKLAVTDSDGEFEFTSLPTGEYRLQVRESSLPDYWAVISARELVVNLKPGRRETGIEFVLEARPRPSRRILIEQTASAAPVPEVGPVRRTGPAVSSLHTPTKTKITRPVRRTGPAKRRGIHRKNRAAVRRNTQ